MHRHKKSKALSKPRLYIWKTVAPHIQYKRPDLEKRDECVHGQPLTQYPKIAPWFLFHIGGCFISSSAEIWNMENKQTKDTWESPRTSSAWLIFVCLPLHGGRISKAFLSQFAPSISEVHSVQEAYVTGRWRETSRHASTSYTNK